MAGARERGRTRDPDPAGDALPAVLAAAAVAGWAVRLGPRDHLLALAPVYYATPAPVLAAIALAAGLLWLRNGRPRALAACAGVAVVTAGIWLGTSTFHGSCTHGTTDVRVLSWNTAHGWAGWRRLSGAIERADADIVGLVEAGTDTAALDASLERWLPGYDRLLPGRGLAVLARGKILDGEMHGTGHGRIVTASIELDGTLWRAVLVDLDSNPLRSRRTMLEDVLAVVGDTHEPTVVMGDFNTPIDSVWFGPFRERFAHAFEQAGTGPLVTWPVPLPVVAVDHVWVSRPSAVRCARLRATVLSDHAQVIATVAADKPDTLLTGTACPSARQSGSTAATEKSRAARASSRPRSSARSS